MNTITEIEKLPLHIQQEVLDYAEFLSQKYQKESVVHNSWIQNITRGKATGETASETTINMRRESQW